MHQSECVIPNNEKVMSNPPKQQSETHTACKTRNHSLIITSSYWVNWAARRSTCMLRVKAQISCPQTASKKIVYLSTLISKGYHVWHSDKVFRVEIKNGWKCSIFWSLDNVEKQRWFLSMFGWVFMTLFTTKNALVWFVKSPYRRQNRKT